MLDLIKNSSADSQQLLGQVIPRRCECVSGALNINSLQIIPVPVVMHEVKKYCRTL
jgi:hypothetical protein